MEIAVISGTPLGQSDSIVATAYVPNSLEFNAPNPPLHHTMASIAPSRLAALVKTRCAVFQTSYNPTSVRTGAKYLRARLRGPSMMNYYPPTLSLSSVIRQFPEMELVDAVEQQRLQDIEDRKKRGKGAPKKAKSKADSRRTSRKR
ncbi:mitochondrial ribosomal subunit S27-domain-containing protein [Thelephora terrestris]|uniref:Small ribosomal subunit protein mS33 n=1 Tax=Thelephora terrestris TaxID=56493 RepID=A0A9P6HS57_9AGAM|nr:mitochondrial ribosomal subunit S27-domain-containing protein [Thelephora terrestris]